MSTDQEYWDACLIKTWRKAGTLWDALSLFWSITGKKIDEIDPPLLRIPRTGFPWKIGVRVFVASYLSKISKRLWEQPPEKDVALLRKLKDSSYDTEAEGLRPDLEMKKEAYQNKKNLRKIEIDSFKYSRRNNATDWNVYKGPKR
jgi:hypothetical protein